MSLHYHHFTITLPSHYHLIIIINLSSYYHHIIITLLSSHIYHIIITLSFHFYNIFTTHYSFKISSYAYRARTRQNVLKTVPHLSYLGPTNTLLSWRLNLYNIIDRSRSNQFQGYRLGLFYSLLIANKIFKNIRLNRIKPSPCPEWLIPDQYID